METGLRTVWILLLVTIFVGVISWSVFTLTNSTVSFLKTCEQTQVEMIKIADNHSQKTLEVLTTSVKIPSLLGNWMEAIVPPEAIEDLKTYTLEYWHEYGKDQMKDTFNMMKGFAAQEKLGITDTQ